MVAHFLAPRTSHLVSRISCLGSTPVRVSFFRPLFSLRPPVQRAELVPDRNVRTTHARAKTQRAGPKSPISAAPFGADLESPRWGLQRLDELLGQECPSYFFLVSRLSSLVPRTLAAFRLSMHGGGWKPPLRTHPHSPFLIPHSSFLVSRSSCEQNVFYLTGEFTTWLSACFVTVMRDIGSFSGRSIAKNLELIYYTV